MIQHPAATHLVHKSSTLCRDLGHKCLSSTTYMHTFSSWPKYQRRGYFKLRIQLCLFTNQLSNRFHTPTEVLFYGVWLLISFNVALLDVTMAVWIQASLAMWLPPSLVDGLGLFFLCHHGIVDPSNLCQVASSLPCRWVLPTSTLFLARFQTHPNSIL